MKVAPVGDDFEGAVFHNALFIDRPLYEGIAVYTGPLGTGPGRPVSIVDNTNGPGTGKWLDISSTYGGTPANGSYDTVFTMRFKKRYSVVSFDSHSVTGWEGDASASVQALDAEGNVIADEAYSHTFPKSAINEPVTLGVAGAAKIKFLKFETKSSGGEKMVWHSIRVDDLVVLD